MEAGASSFCRWVLTTLRWCVHRPRPLVCCGHRAETWTPCRPLEPLCTVIGGQAPALPPSVHRCNVFPFAFLHSRPPSPSSVQTSTPFLPHQPPILTTQLSHCPAISQHSEGPAHRSLLCVQGDGRRHRRERWSKETS